MWYWFFKFVGLGPLAWWFLGLRWRGRENLPKSGPFILASNHIAFIDPVGISMGVPRKVIFVAKSKYYSGKGIGGRLLGWFLSAIGQVPIDPQSASAANPALETSRRLLAEGGVVAIFPEGTRSPDGRLYRGRTGVARLALPTGVPIVPVGVTGTRDVRLPGSKCGIRRGPVTIDYGTPLDLSAWAGREEDPAAWREVTDLLMSRIAGLTGQAQVDRYPSGEETRARDAA